MKTKLIFSTEKREIDYWSNLPFIPRIDEMINVKDILKNEEVNEIQKSAYCWSGIHGKVKSVEYRHDDNEFYIEMIIMCED
ncbi:MAG TPA: hypothetical protein PLR88_01200 [Bacteroidales bacterium]|nr:hypothetical protein [Bacteroidales bacterium]